MSDTHEKNTASKELIMSKILVIRGKKVIIDMDLAKLYGVETKRLNEQVKRNIKRFPSSFMFQITKQEKDQVVANCDHLKKHKILFVLAVCFYRAWYNYVSQCFE